jgi:hypothetical protein
MVRKRTLIITLLLAFATTTVIAESNDPSLGTWILNSTKSKLPGPAPKLFIQRYELRPDGFIVSTRISIAPDGTPQFEQASMKHDGKDYEWWDNSTLSAFLSTGKRLPKKLSMKPVDALTVEYTGKESGKVTVTGRRIISSDGKTMTLAGKSLIPSGEWIPYEAVFDKQ